MSRQRGSGPGRSAYRVRGGPGRAGHRGGRWGRCGAPFRQPVALAVAARAADFERLRALAVFGAAAHPPAAHPQYLCRTERQLRALGGLGLEVHLRLLDAAGYQDFCAERLLDPAEPAARTAYAADPDYPGEPFVYRGEPLAELLPALVADHDDRLRMLAGCSALLAAAERAGGGAGVHGRASAALGYAGEVLLAVAAGAGPGRHRLVLRAASRAAGELAAETELSVAPGRLSVAGRPAEAFCVTLAAALAGAAEGELLLHRVLPEGSDGGAAGVGAEVLGWAVAGGGLRPMVLPPARAAPVGTGRVRPGFRLPVPPPGPG